MSQYQSKNPSVSSLRKYLTSKLTGVQNYEAIFLNISIGLIIL